MGAADLTGFLDMRWAFHLGCVEGQLRDGGRHVVRRPEAASQRESPWPLRRGPICVFTTGPGWVMSVPDDVVEVARSLCVGSSFEELVSEGDRLQQEWFDQMQATGERGADRGDGGYRVMNSVARPLQLRGWSHYIHSYCDAASWRRRRDAHVCRIAEDRPEIWEQWQRWAGSMVGARVQEHFEVADAFGYVLDGEIVSAAQVEAGARDFAWEYGVETLPEFRCRGFATAVVQSVTAFMIEQGRIPWHYCDAYNRPSVRLPEKAGYFRYGEGLFSAV